MSENKKIKGIGILPGDTIDGQPMPDRYYAILKYGHLGIYDTLEEAVEARCIVDKEE